MIKYDAYLNDTLRSFNKIGNNIGQVISDTGYVIIDATTKASEIVFLTTYQYSGSQVSRIDTFDYTNNNFSLRSYSTFSYDGNGNLLKETNYSSNSTLLQTIDYNMIQNKLSFLYLKI